jgi:hypothetical protein
MSIKPITLKNGITRYRVVIDVGPPGQRQQRTYTFDDEDEAKRQHQAMRIERQQMYGRSADGKLTGPTVDDLLDDYLDSLTCSEKTRDGYAALVRPIRTMIGRRKAQTIKGDDVERVRAWMLARGRRRGGRPGSSLSGRTVDQALGRLRAAYELGAYNQKITRRTIPVSLSAYAIVL